MAQEYELSERQETILRKIERHTATHARPPTLRELARDVGLASIGALSYQLKQLEEMALLVRERYLARGIQLTEEALALIGQVGERYVQPGEMFYLPIRGDIGASTPLDTGNDTFETYGADEGVAIDSSMLPRRHDGLFAVRVRGDSMIDALICDGDIVIMQVVHDVRNGDMVAAWLKLEQELTLKQFFLEQDTVRLQPANRAMKPILTPATNVDVQARVVSVLRGATGYLTS